MPNLLPGTQFRLTQDTRAINQIPNLYGRINEEGIFPATPIPTTSVRIAKINGVLSIIPAVARGAAPFLNENETRDVRILPLLHYPIMDKIQGEDVQNVVDWTTGTTMDTITDKVMRSMRNIRNKHAITKEWSCMGALKGLVINDDLSTLVDLYTEFNVTKKTVTIPLSTATTDVRAYCFEIVRHIEDSLMGDVMNGVDCWCSQELFDALIGHKFVRESYLNYAEGQERVGGDVRKNFTYGGIKFSEYRAVATDRSGTSRKFITANYGHAFPRGTMDTFEIFYGPPVLNSLNQANVNGQEMFALQTPDPKGRYIELDTEMNILPICRRPAVLVEVTKS